MGGTLCTRRAKKTKPKYYTINNTDGVIIKKTENEYALITSNTIEFFKDGKRVYGLEDLRRDTILNNKYLSILILIGSNDFEGATAKLREEDI